MTATTTTAPGEALRRFASGLRWRHVRGQALSTALRVALALSAPAALLLWLLPSTAALVGWAALALATPLVLLSALRAYRRGGRAMASFGARVAGQAAGLEGVSDELLTWLERDARGERGGMLQWLERDVRERLRPHERAALAAVGRPSVGRWRWMLPVIALVLLAWLLTSLWQPPWSGALGGAENQAQRGGGGARDEQPATPQAPGDAPDDTPEDAPADGGGGERDEPEAQPEPQRESQAAQEEPAPLLELPEQQRFVLPEFIGDGPTRRARMRAAELEQQVGPAASSPPPRAGGGDEASPEPPPAAPEEFARAAEQALRARHVPPSERAIVRRFFERLQRADEDG